MELRQLRYFVTVAEHLHFGRAAQQLHIVQPAVSQQVRRLERELGVTLFDRSPRQVRLTRAGERLLPEAHAVLAAADRTAAVAAGLTAAQQGTLRIGTSPGLSSRLAGGLDVLANQCPDIDVQLDSRPVGQQLESVRNGDLDVAFLRGMPGKLAEDSTINAVPLLEEPVRIALTATHQLATRRRLRLQELAELPLRLPSQKCDPLLHAFVLDACRRAGFEPRRGRPSGSTPDTLVEVGAGSPAWTPLYGDADQFATSDKITVLELDPALTVTVSLVTSATRAPTCVEALHDAFTSPAPAPTSPGGHRHALAALR
ncbi:LysR family transcriptional regulator [Phytoactinopolyspora mesophila]|uniref:LysR family transcriptional regulator n=1 Tax=Phytoactinopolyspora mesophila TaxID=2650750 RepID=A0A7K3M198_9ACTN|nr:LysR family transcriptional regulator [Phytoactinopolyspora mesophila]NDL57071.1 LysR family transcriptional regulator [Phytoactinopolyspora mesophila]